MNQPYRSLGDLLALPLRSGVSVPASERGAGIKMLNMGELFRHPQIPDIEMARVTLRELQPERHLLESGDLVFARRSLTLEGAGKCSIVKEMSEPTTWESSIIRARLDRAAAYPQYYFYFFASPLGRRLVEGIVEQVAASGIRLSELRSLQVPVPGLSEQRAIAEVLGALDDKIAANIQLARTADDYSATLLDRTLTLSPWELVPVGDLCEVNAESVRPVPGEMLRYIDIASVSVGSYEYPERTSWDTAPSRARRGIRREDTLWSTVRPNRRSHALNMSDDQELVGSTALAVLSPLHTGFAYLYEVTRRPGFTAFLESAAEGSAYPAVRAGRLAETPVPLVPAHERDAFELVAAPLRTHLDALGRENLTLAATRDALLPQLMSGRLRVKDAEQIVEGAT